MKINLTDGIIILIVLFFNGIGIFFWWSGRQEPAYVVIHSTRGEEIYSLQENRIWQFEDERGVVKIKIEEGRAFFVESFCNGKDCIRMGNIVGGLSYGACLPAGVWMEVEGGDEVDSIVY